MRVGEVITAEVVSAGSTPTFAFSTGSVITEIRPGEYVFCDLNNTRLGACEENQIALFVAATVVSDWVPDQVILDVGTKALGREGNPEIGYGGIAGKKAVLAKLNEYHGFVAVPGGEARPGSTVALPLPRHWNRPGPWGVSGGTSYADTGYQPTWEATRGQPGRPGILVAYTGGATTDALFLGHPYGNTQDRNAGVIQDARRFLARIEPVFPGLGQLWNGRPAGAIPHLNPLWNCSYSYWRVGQYQTIAGYEAVPQGQVYFAGEHTSVEFQGFMEGAASSGVRVARQVVAAARQWR